MIATARLELVPATPETIRSSLDNVPALGVQLTAAVAPGFSLALSVLALFVIVEPIVGYVVEPMLYGHSTGLSPVSVVIAAIFWTWIWGPVGLVLARDAVVEEHVLRRVEAGDAEVAQPPEVQAATDHRVDAADVVVLNSDVIPRRGWLACLQYEAWRGEKT